VAWSRYPHGTAATDVIDIPIVDFDQRLTVRHHDMQARMGLRGDRIMALL